MEKTAVKTNIIVKKTVPGIKTKKGKIDTISVRMYRPGTGDFFILQFKSAGDIRFNLMIDCGCINGSKEIFEPLVEDLRTITGGVIDLLVVTHEHADHINGFQKASELFDQFVFKKVWFAWTESKSDPKANDYRKNFTKIKMALNAASTQLNNLVGSNYYDNLFSKEYNGHLMIEGRKGFITSINELSRLNINIPLAAANKIPTMEDLLREWKVIKEHTEVEFLEPGEMKSDIKGAEGLRFFVLGPPKDIKSLSLEEKDGETYEKRENASSVDFALMAALNDGSDSGVDFKPFDEEYECSEAESLKDLYTSQEYRNIDHDWLFGSGSLALRFQRSINNTSLALAIQFEDSEKVLLFPGDAEFGNWQSWHDPTMKWSIKKDGKTENVSAEYLLNNTVFYKVGHHLSQNGTAKGKGLEMMIHEDLAAMATLDFKKINKGWLNTMPNDLVGAKLISKTKGRLFFAGDRKKILDNIKTDRVTVKSNVESDLNDFNKKFDGLNFIEYDVKG